MISLFIDTSNFRLIVGVVSEKENKILSYYNENLNSDLSVKVLDVVKTCIESAEITPNDVDKIYAVNGPGSFTGIRIGVTIAKTFAWALKKEVIPISSLEVIASTNCSTKYIVPMIDARRDCVFAGIYDNDLNVVMEDKYISLEELKKESPLDITYISDDIFDSIEVSLPNVDILKVINKHKNDKSVEPHHLKPSYLKITEAEANLNKKND